jgi:hypothetical protein
MQNRATQYFENSLTIGSQTFFAGEFLGDLGVPGGSSLISVFVFLRVLGG